MKSRLLFAVSLCLVQCAALFAQKSLYIPYEWKNFNSRDTLLYAEVDTLNQYTWSKTRSKESENFICYWDKYYDREPTKLPTSNYYRVDIDDLLQKAEQFYALNVGQLAFCDEATSKVRRYKMMILMNHTQTWTCYGGGYDNTIGALWLNPATCKPVGHSVAHEVGHSFQYQCFSDLGGYAGFREAIGNGSAFWEQTAQWQAAQAYPSEKFNQSWSVFEHTANYAMTHEWMRYQSYWWHYYLTEKYGIDFIGRLWRYRVSKAADPNEVFMEMTGYDVRQLYKEYFDYAMKMATLDLDVCRSEADSYIGTYDYKYVNLGGTKFQVAYASCPQATGFNVIPLNVPKAGTTISTNFVSLKNQSLLATGDPAQYFNGDSRYVDSGKLRYNNIGATDYKTRGFRLGYVALLKDGTRLYSSEDSVYCTGTSALKNIECKTQFTVPENVKGLWMVVVPAPSIYFQHRWDEDISNDDQWPYTVEFIGTNIKGAPIISDDMEISDATIVYDVDLPKATSNYSSAIVMVDGDAASVLGTAFQMQPSEMVNHLVDWNSAGPADGEVMFYALDADGEITNANSTANGYGHWFSSTGNRCEWGNSTASTFSEYIPGYLAFQIGQYPNRLTVGKTYKIGQAFKYKKEDKEAVVRIFFNVICKSASSTEGYELVSASLDNIEPELLVGDVDGDGEISVADVTMLIEIYLKTEIADMTVCDLDGDGILTIEDIARLIELYLAGTEETEE
ncbi:MAG: DUF4859 domain-containing protein [Bacteroidaceae bacterium]|nr:DUF4859 domain-containing protein [Bacteroidaceae bacterium]